MSRKEAQNNFGDGLIMDLNPINTPNTVLTDDINGTIITYNGNEYTLQNDMGNYPLKNCKLKKNYIPIGVKEYGDILYIASYNPLTERFELGSYPSPKTISSTDDTDDSFSGFKSVWENLSATTDYADIKSSYQEMKVFLGDEYKLNPGDMYYLQMSGYNNCDYESLNYFVIDSDQKAYDITKNVAEDGFPQSSVGDFKYVSWKNPGWFAIQPHFIDISDFKVNIRKIIVSDYDTNATVNINLQIISSDETLLLHPELRNNFSANVIIKVNNTEKYNQNISFNACGILDLKNGSVIFYKDLSTISLSGVNDNSQITIEVKPKLSITKSGTTKTVTFNDLNKTLVFNAGQKANVSNFKLGESSWWYSVDKESNKLKIKFDTSGIPQSSVLSSDIYLHYTLKRWDIVNNTWTLVVVQDGNGVNYENKLIGDWTLIGETIIELPLVDYTDTTYSSNRLFAEDIYIMELSFHKESTVTANNQIGTTTKKLIVATELMNGFTDSRYDLITFDRWMGKYIDSVQNKNFVVNNITLGSSGTPDTEATTSENFALWKAGNDIVSKYRTYIPDTVDLSDGFTVSAGYTYTATINYKTNFKALSGPLWYNLLNNAKLYSELGDSHIHTINNYTGESSTTVNDSSNVSVQKTNNYKLQQASAEKTIWDYNKENLKISGNSTYVMTFEGKALNNEGKKVGVSTIFDNQAIKSDGQWFTRNSEGISRWTPPCTTALNNLKTKYDCSFLTITPKMVCNGAGSYAQYTRCGIINLNADVNTDRWDSDYNWLSTTTGSSNTSTIGDAVYFIVFNANGSLPILVKVDDYDSFATWSQYVDHIICDDSTALRGSFYKATKLTASNEVPSFKYNIVGGFVPTNFEYRGIKQNITSGINMFNTSSRESLAGQTGANNFASNISITSIPEIKFTESSGEKTVDASFGSAIDALLDAVDDDITAYNSEIDTQYATMSSDTIYSSGLTSNSDVYQYKSDVPSAYNKGNLLAFLNKTATSGTAIKGWVRRVHYSEDYVVCAMLGYYDSTDI